MPWSWTWTDTVQHGPGTGPASGPETGPSPAPWPDPGPGMVRSVWLTGGTHSASLLIGRCLQLHNPCHLIVGVHILVNHQLVISQRHLGCWWSFLLLLHELPQFCSLVSDLLGEIFSNVDVASWQKLCFPTKKIELKTHPTIPIDWCIYLHYLASYSDLDTLHTKKMEDFVKCENHQ